MTSLTIQARTLSPDFSPRGARVAAEWFGRLLALFSDDSAAIARTRSDEAEHVRSLARRYQATEPSFAADLFAAAARHEGLDDL